MAYDIAFSKKTTGQALPHYEVIPTTEAGRTVAQVLNVRTKQVRWRGPAADSISKAYDGLLEELISQKGSADRSVK